MKFFGSDTSAAMQAPQHCAPAAPSSAPAALPAAAPSAQPAHSTTTSFDPQPLDFDPYQRPVLAPPPNPEVLSLPVQMSGDDLATLRAQAAAASAQLAQFTGVNAPPPEIDAGQLQLMAEAARQSMAFPVMPPPGEHPAAELLGVRPPAPPTLGQIDAPGIADLQRQADLARTQLQSFTQ